jgi:pimeloyl-ACP methyl ester carboxylesterase
MNHVSKLVDGGKGVVSTFQQGYDELVRAIIRPPRSSYDASMLGPRRFMFAGKVYVRQDIDVVSNRPDRSLLKCSHFKPEVKQEERPLRRPCVIFCHGNAASRQEGLSIIKTVLAASADLFLFDFAGSGLSEGEWVSLGHFEKEDLAAVVDKLRASGATSIGLWGRSMGAVTALLYAVRDPMISGIVVDSPFTDLRTLAGELCAKETYGAVPSWLADAALSVIRVSIQQRVGFDLDELCPIDLASSTNIPAIFAAAVDDDFIYPHHAKMIQEEY